MSAAKRYRLLRAGEIVRKGDEADYGKGWIRTCLLIGLEVSKDWYFRVRRRVRKPIKRKRACKK